MQRKLIDWHEKMSQVLLADNLKGFAAYNLLKTKGGSYLWRKTLCTKIIPYPLKNITLYAPHPLGLGSVWLPASILCVAYCLCLISKE